MDFSNIKNMHTALNAYTLRNETINKNLANVNTPNYKREVVSFEEYLDKSKNKYISGFKTNSKHIDIPSNNSSEPYTIKRDMSVSTREDGNNVNADVEAANQVKNTVNYNAVVQRISSNFQTLKTAIRGGS